MPPEKSLARLLPVTVLFRIALWREPRSRMPEPEKVVPERHLVRVPDEEPEMVVPHLVVGDESVGPRRVTDVDPGDLGPGRDAE